MTAWQRFAAQPGARAGLVALGLLVLVGAGADLVASDLPLAVSVDGQTWILPCLLRPAALRTEDQAALARRARWMVPTPIPFGPLSSRGEAAAPPLSPPSWRHLVGTDDRGRDVAARLVHGARTALLVGLVAVGLYLAAGLLVGAACAIGPVADLVLARVIEVGGVVPAYFVLLAVQAALSARGASLLEVAAAIALTRWPEVARVTRLEALRAAASPHVEAARALGLGPVRIALRHVLPLAAGPALVVAAVGLGQAVLLEAGLAFLGFGVPPPTPSWGELFAEAHAAGMPPNLVLAPAAAIALLLLAAGRVADGVRAVLDPRSA